MPSRSPIPHVLAPSEPKPKKVRASKMGKWRAAVLIGVHVLIGLHIAHWLTAGETITPVEPSEAMAFSRASIVNAGLIFFAVTILATAVFGRFFCGWGCHVLALQDLCRHWMLKLGITPRPLRSRLLAWVPALAFLYMFVWPAVYRIWIGDDLSLREAELTTSAFWATFPGWVVGFLTLLVCGFATVYFLGAKGFCTYACPYGAIFAAVDRVAPMRIRVTDACEQCGHCTAVCSSNVRVHEEVRDWGMVVSPGCMKCQDCISVCPKDALYYGAGPIPLFAKPRVEDNKPPKRAPLSWSQELLLAAVFALSFVILRGLYGLVPFLMSLGAAGVIAFLTLTTVRLTREATVERSGLRLKRQGKLLPQGKLFVLLFAVLALFLAHSAAIRVRGWLADQDYTALSPARRALLAAPNAVPELTTEQLDRARSALAHIESVERWGLVHTAANAARLAWLQTLLDDPRAEQSARDAIVANEWPAEMHQLLAHHALRDGNDQAAQNAWRAAIEVRPDMPEGYLALGTTLAAKGELDAAREWFDRGREAVPRSPELHYNAALARALAGQAEASIPLFERALTLNPDYREARENLAGVLASLGRFEASIAEFCRALERAPKDAGTRVFLARALLGAGDHVNAERQLRRALELDTNRDDARALLTELSGTMLPDALSSLPISCPP